MEQAPVRYYEAAEPPVRAAVGGSDFLRAVSNIDLTDALKEARPDAYNDLVHSLQRLQYRDVSEQQELLIILG